MWHDRGMAKSRLSTTVDTELLASARALCPTCTDASMIEEALRSLLRDDRRAEIERRDRAAYAAHPFDEPDEWGDLASWGAAAGRAR
jgi:Arc/MetJ family transcription regulator